MLFGAYFMWLCLAVVPEIFFYFAVTVLLQDLIVPLQPHLKDCISICK